MAEHLKLNSSAFKFLAGLCLLLFVATLIPTAEASIKHYKWEVKQQYKSPDCFKKEVITINDGTPGPTISARQGDTVRVEVTNSLKEDISIHWHGIRQIGTPWNDGTSGVSQCPILPGETFTYEFVVDRPGTYMYHSHFGMQRQNGLYGSIIVDLSEGEKEPFSYNYDRSIILNDWYHKSPEETQAGLTANPYVWVGEPQSLLINGKGKFECSGLKPSVCDSENRECSFHTMTVMPGKTYRLRIGSMTSLSALSFQIEGHDMTVVEADGHYVEPFVVKNLFIYSGETYSVLIKADQNPDTNYWMTTHIVSRDATKETPPGLGLLAYYPNPARSGWTAPPTGPAWDDVEPRLSQSLAIKAHPDFIDTPPKYSNRAIVFLNTQNKVDGHVRWSVNNVSFTLPRTPYLIALKQKLTHEFDQTPPPTNYDYENYDIYSVPSNPSGITRDGLYRLRFGTTVDIILQNANTMKAHTSETHPWHLHGHDFWVLGHGEGKFRPGVDEKKYNLKNPIMKNTVPVHPYGWTALRFKADNPGVWAFHCHIEPHFYLGMGVVFEEGIDRVGDLPSSIMECAQR